MPDGSQLRIDNCQHVLLRCCTALMDFYRRCGVVDRIRFHDTLHLVTPGGIVDSLRADKLPVPLHLARSVLGLRCLNWRDKLNLARCLLAARSDQGKSGTDEISFADWLRQKGARAQTVARFWRPFVVSALNEEPDRASAYPALQVFGDGLLGGRTSYQLGVPSVPLDDLYCPVLAGRLGPTVRFVMGSRISRIHPSGGDADYYISAVPFDRVRHLIPDLGIDGLVAGFEHSPITGIHLWFNREITELQHALLLDREIQWLFHRGGGYYLVVVSASRNLQSRPTSQIVALALRELQEFFPAVRTATLTGSRVIREARATYSACPGLERMRPGPRTRFPNVFLAGDWTNSGWPATMEGAVRSGYRAAEAVIEAAGAGSGDGPGCKDPADAPRT